MSVMEIISKVLDLIKTYFNYKTIKEETNKLKNKDKDSLKEKKKEISDAVNNGDVDKINQLINSCIIVALSCILFCGCSSPNVIYVPGDRQVKKLTYENVEGYFVPTQVMSELLQYKAEAEYYKEKYEN